MSIFRNVFKNLHKRCFQTSKYSTAIESNAEELKPIIDIRSYDSEKYFHKSREVWLENFDTVEEKKLGLINLHPEIFAAQPRIDIIHENVKWQRLYNFVVRTDDIVSSHILYHVNWSKLSYIVYPIVFCFVLSLSFRAMRIQKLEQR